MRFIISSNANDFHFYSDIDDDNLVEGVRFFIEGTQLKQGITEPSGVPLSYDGAETVSVISSHVRNIEQSVTAFHYFDNTGMEITDYNKVDEVRFVTMNLVVNVSPDRLPNQLTLRSSATLRNVVNQ